MDYDLIEQRDGALFHHGKANNRLYLMKWNGENPDRLLAVMSRLAAENGYTKIFIKIPAAQADFFTAEGFEEEARIPAYYGTEACIFMGKFLDPARKIVNPDIRDTMDRNLALARGRKTEASPALAAGYTLRELTGEDCTQLAELYTLVFKTYPFPVHDPAYLEQTMEDHIVYFGVFSGNRLVAASSAEMDEKTSSVEFTDFATNPEYRGNSFASTLLGEMQKAMTERGITTQYTIARALSAGMNITFAKAGYRYAGTLVNNTDISGTIESMNVWYRGEAAVTRLREA